MSRADQARMAVETRKRAEMENNSHETVIIFDEEDEQVFSQGGHQLSLLGTIWRPRKHNRTKEKVVLKHTINNSILVIFVEESESSLSIYSDEDKAEIAVKYFMDFFGTKLKSWGLFRPCSVNEEFVYFIFRESLMRNLSVALSVFDAEKEKHITILKDVVKEMKSEFLNENISYQMRGYIEDNLKARLSNIQVIM